jgi:sodium--glutamate symport carrier gltS
VTFILRGVESMLAFLATIGLGADARMLAKGGGALVLFVACVVGMLILENIIRAHTCPQSSPPARSASLK